jgi:hypothetical protein
VRGFSLPELRRLARIGEPSGESSFLARLPGIPTFRELRPALDIELRRSRRYERPLTALVVVPDIIPLHWAEQNGSPVPDYTPDAGGVFARAGRGRTRSDNGNGAAASGGDKKALEAEQRTAEVASIWTIYSTQLRFLLLGSLLAGALRECDIVSYAAEHHEFFALLPECDIAAARQAVERLHTLYVRRTGTGLQAGAAVYPRDGLTLDALMDHARHTLSQEPIRPAVSRLGAGGVAHG